MYSPSFHSFISSFAQSLMSYTLYNINKPCLSMCRNLHKIQPIEKFKTSELNILVKFIELYENRQIILLLFLFLSSFFFLLKKMIFSIIKQFSEKFYQVFLMPCRRLNAAGHFFLLYYRKERRHFPLLLRTINRGAYSIRVIRIGGSLYCETFLL